MTTPANRIAFGALLRHAFLAAAMAAAALPGSPAGAQAPATPAAAAPPERLARIARSIADRGLFSGAVLVARGDQVLLSQGDGLAHPGWGIRGRGSTGRCRRSPRSRSTCVAASTTGRRATA